MSKKRRNVGNLAALGGAALLAMKLAKGNRKDAAPIEDKGIGKKESKPSVAASMSDSMRKQAEEDIKESGMGRYAQETGIGTMRQPARDSGKTSARTTAARTPAAAPAARTPAPSAAPSAAPRVNRAEGITASGLPREARGIEPTRSAANQFFGDDMRPMAIRARQMAREGEFEPLRSGMKKGGTVKKKSGGMVSKASKRADGVAKRGKTKCKIC